ncbi:MAG TPA: aminopeptidase [Steroidobacteraceae bacterium]|nr:aminopeptidase [Steroidobacteraceae bacterium]
MLNEFRTPAARRWLGWPLLVLGCLCSAGCGAGYLLQAAHGQLQILQKRRPIAKVLASADTDSVTRQRLLQVQSARDFASRELGLPDNRSYRSYADLGRPYVVWNVVAAPEFSVTPRSWCFPFVGCLAYRGYFKEQAAQRYAAQLAAQGDDTLVGGVTAYSTLGHFSDPVLNTMLAYGDLQLAGTLFHELAHQLIYVKGDSVFNESFAMTVEREGLKRWLAAQGREAELAGYLQRREQQRSVVDALAAGRQQLAALYRQEIPVEEMRQRKRALLDQLGQQVLRIEREGGFVSGYSGWAKTGLNNAHLAAVGTYFDCIPAFERLLQEQGGKLPDFYAAVRRLGRQPAAERKRFCTP